MALLSPPLALGAAGQVVTAKTLRLGNGAAFAPGATGVLGVSGCLAGPAGTMGELTLPTATTLTVQAFRAVVQNTQDATAGQYVAINDAAVTLAVTAQHATQFRRSLVLVEVNDSQTAGVASSATTDRNRLYLADGPLAASAAAAALPALPANSLALGEVLIPPTGQTVTLTPYNPRTTGRGGILPVLNDASTVPGHAGAPPLFDGQYRDHPTRGLQRGRADGTWRAAAPLYARAKVLATTINGAPAAIDAKVTGWSATALYDTHGMWNGTAKQFVIPWAGEWRITIYALWSAVVAGNNAITRIVRGQPTSPPTNVLASAVNTSSNAGELTVLAAWTGALAAGDVITHGYYTQTVGNFLSAQWGSPGYFLLEEVGPDPATA